MGADVIKVERPGVLVTIPAIGGLHLLKILRERKLTSLPTLFASIVINALLRLILPNPKDKTSFVSLQSNRMW